MLPKILWSKWEQQVNLKKPPHSLGIQTDSTCTPDPGCKAQIPIPITACDPCAWPRWVLAVLNVSLFWEILHRKYFNIRVSRDGALSVGADTTTKLQWDARYSLAPWMFNWAMQSGRVPSEWIDGPQWDSPALVASAVCQEGSLRWERCLIKARPTSCGQML